MYIIIIMVLVLVTGIIIYEQDKRIKKLIRETWELGEENAKLTLNLKKNNHANSN